MTQTHAVVFTGPRQAQVLPFDLPEPGPGQVLIEVHASAVSVGTEMRVFKGIQEPGQAFPQVPGYANSGVVLEAGEGAGDLLGRRVTAGGSHAGSLPLMWGGHAAHSVIGAEGVLEIPDHLSFAEAALNRLGAIAWRGFDLAQAREGDEILIIGLGVIGQMAARIYKARGFACAAVDLAEPRVEAARADGVDARLVRSLDEARSIFSDCPDLIVDATGSERVLREAIGLARVYPWDNTDHRPTRYVIQGSYPGDICIPYQRAFDAQLSFLLPRDNQRKDRVAFLELQSSGRAPSTSCITEFPVSEAPEVYRRCVESDPSLIAPVLVWR